MEKEGFVEFDGKVVEILPNTLFRVKVDDKVILCYLSGKMRMHYIKITPGDKVKIQVSLYDPDRGRIIYRY